jgi:hypothetical protein
MPIYERDMSYEDMKKAVQAFKCAQCSSDLVIAWSPPENSYQLRCRVHPEHEGVVPWGRDPGLDQLLHLVRGKELQMESTALQKMDEKGMMARIEKAKWPKELTVQDKQLVAKVSIEYGLDPLFGELMVYQGRPYVTIDARRRKAQETGNLDGISARPATREERTARGVPDKDFLFVAQVWVKEAAHPFEGWGRVKESETKGDPHLPIVKDPGAQAEKRAEAQALRRAFHLPLPSFEEVIEGEFTALPDGKDAPKSKPSPTKAAVSPPAPPPAGAATEPQIRKIWADAKQAGYRVSEVNAVIKQKWGAESVKDLTIAQASTLIDMIKRGEGISAPKPPDSGPEAPIHEEPDDSN